MSKRAGVDVGPQTIHRQVWSVDQTHFYSQEWGAFIPRYLEYEPPVVLATCLRNPIDRYVSEFGYAGPGSAADFDETNAAAEWRRWIQAGDDRRGAGGVRRGRYVDNFFIRSLLGRPSRDGPVRLHPRIPYFGDSWIFGGGGALYRGRLGRRQLQEAQRVLASFDIVLLNERLNDTRTLERLGRFLDDDKVCVVHLRRSPRRRELPEEIERWLVADNAWDIELVEFVRDRLPGIPGV
jgi:hypothetical protein